jgi:hypothetical protein
LTRIYENVNPCSYPRCAFIFIGIIVSQLFYYNCGNKFNTDIIQPYFKLHSGSIIFVNGDQCLIYEHTIEFRKKKHITANLIKRHHKGGQSSIRFARLAEESRLHYVTHIIDNHLNALNTSSNWIFGSDEIRTMIMDRLKDINIPINNGGFLEFTEDTICDRKKWLSYLETEEKEDNNLLEKIVYYLDTDPDFLDFDPSKMNEMCAYIINDKKISDSENGKKIHLSPKFINYSRLIIFPYIGLRWYKYEDMV